jgi:hypothetical protein
MVPVMAGTGLPVTNRRAVRGGSWNNNQNNAHCAYRNNNNPNNRNNNIGFRLLCSSHILSPLATAQVWRFVYCRPVAGAPTVSGPGSAFGIDRRSWFTVRGAGLKMAQVSPGRTDSI